MLVKKEYLLFAVIILVAVLGIVGRVCVQKMHVARLNAQIEQLTETTKIQNAQIDEITARLRAAQADQKSTNAYGERVEAILQERSEVKDAVQDAVARDAEYKAWADCAVPDGVCELLRERLCTETNNTDTH